MTKQEAQEWLLDNELLINNVTKFEKQKQLEFFEAYNALNSIKKTQTSCGRCIHNMRVNLQDHIKQIKKMTRYPVYLTEKGNPTFKENGEPVHFIHTSTKEGAEEALRLFKRAIKDKYKKEDNG